MSAATKPAAAATTLSLQNVVLTEIQSAANQAAVANHMPNLLPVNEASLGDLPWFWQNGTNFNKLSYEWINNIFVHSNDGNVGTSGEPLTTAYLNVLDDITFVLDAADQAAVNNANLKAAVTANTLISDWTTTQGPFPPNVTTQAAELAFITSQVVTSWGTPGLLLGTFRNSTNPTALLPNIPLGAEQIVADLMEYLNVTSPVENIQSAVLSSNNQLKQTKNNVDPVNEPATATAGFMEIVDDKGNMQVVPEITIVESTAQILNALLPSSGGTSFSAKYTATAQNSSTVQVTSAAIGAVGVGAPDLFLAFKSESSSFNMFSFASSLTSCEVTLLFNGVTTFTPTYSPYNVSTGFGWWNPDPIEQAANPAPNQSGYNFTPTPPFNFGVNGNFGVISRLLISQQPIISLTYSTSDFAAFQEVFQQDSKWGITFLGIGLGGGSSSYYQAQTSQDSSTGTVTLTMSPVGITTPITPTDQLAYVVGAQILWPGASTSPNQPGI
ncbi:MAG TPA: hypothetical protein VKK31_02625 [Thermoanaerobaculia bacterium]|nr:hypothetical protein [Thermoanaerobaculia bacterium]